MPDGIGFAPQDTGRETGEWSWFQCALFRFGLLYLALTSCFWFFEFADRSTALIARPFHALWRPLTRWIAVHLYHWPANVSLNFVRDTRYLYALLTCFFLVSLVAAAVWSILDRRRRDYNQLNDWLRVFLRYALAYLLLHYGMDKVFLLQFPAPSLTRLTEPLGDYSPSSLMWTFIGSSVVYTVFGGLAEVAGGLLLLFRRTTTLGALIGFAVMFNVAVMDFSYDVAVKLLCLHMLLMAVYLAMPDARRVLNLFVFNRPTLPVNLGPHLVRPSQRRLLLALKISVLAYLFLSLTVRDWKAYNQTGPGAARPPLYGLYAVEEFSANGVTRPPLLTDTERWRYVIIDTPNQLAIRHMDDSLTTYRAAYEEAAHQIHFDNSGSRNVADTLTVSQLGNGAMQLDGTLDGAKVSARLVPIDPSRFTLINRGFHWISETSFIH
jgi:uncharacterized membrane protein YphA (DoxX/SURF4 family)